MSIAGAAIAAASISANVATAAAKKTPPKRTALALADGKLVPEPR